MRLLRENKQCVINKIRTLIIACTVFFCLGATCNETEEDAQPSSTVQSSASSPKSESQDEDVTSEEIVKYSYKDTAPVIAQMSDLEVRVRKAIRHYPSRKTARSLGDEAVPILISVLQDEKEMKNWKRTTGLIGHIGNEEALDPLIDFLEKPTGVLPGRKCYEFGGVVFSIGLIAAAGSDRAYEYLKHHLREEDWNNVKWTCDNKRNTMEKQQWYFARKAIIGIAITGRNEAKVELQGLLTEKIALPDTSKKRQMVDLIEEALRQLERIQQHGLDGYFDRVKR